MKYVYTFLLIVVSASAHAQGVEYYLSNITERKWIGATTFMTKSEPNNTDLTFSYKDHVLKQHDRQYNSDKPLAHWWVIKGNSKTDPNIIIRLAGVDYTAEFSTTNNGQDYLTLTRIPQHEWETLVVKTYYAE